MNRLGDRSAEAGRGPWLAELSEAIDQAQQLARTLSSAAEHCPEAEDLYARLEAIRIEIENLRLGGWGGRPAQIDPRWSILFPSTGRPVP